MNKIEYELMVLFPEGDKHKLRFIAHDRDHLKRAMKKSLPPGTTYEIVREERYTLK